MKTHRTNAFTLIELLVVISIIAILASFAVPAMTGALLKAQMTQSVNNAKQIHLATFSMSTDRSTTGDQNLGWPGDLEAVQQAPGGGGGASPGSTGPVTTVSAFVNRLVAYDYLKAADVGKVFTAPGIIPWSGVGPFDGNLNSAFKIYKVTESDGGATIFLATKNFTYNQNFTDAMEVLKPYGTKGFVVFRKGGDGAVYKKQNAVQPTLIGYLPGTSDPMTPGQETAQSILIQQ